MENKRAQTSIHEKINVLKQTMVCLDSVSCQKGTAITVINGEFTQIISMFLRKDLNDILGDYSE